MSSQEQTNIDWQNMLDYISTNVTDPQRTHLLTLCKKFEARLEFTKPNPPQSKIRQTKKDIQNKLMSENPNAGNLQNILKGFI